jgi:hypothetical protein
MLACSSGGRAGEIHHPRIGFAYKSGHFSGRHAGIDAACPGPYAAAGQDQRHMLRTVLGRHQHPIAGAHTIAAQLRFQGIHHPRQNPQGDDTVLQQ